ncbi:MAG: LysM peptidoglycan-binding domain-containing protein, partial [Aestuariivirgaceae bacterium]
MSRVAFLLSIFVAVAFSPPASAQTCGKTYKVKAGDTLSAISQKAYRSGRKWSLIYYANRDVIGDDPTFIYPGQKFSVPCADQAAKALAKTAAANAAAPAVTAGPASNKIRLLTADDYRPFTDRALPAGGMITDIINTALKTQKDQANGPAFDVNWVNDWSAHLNPLLVNRA